VLRCIPNTKILSPHPSVETLRKSFVMMTEAYEAGIKLDRTPSERRDEGGEVVGNARASEKHFWDLSVGS